ncbi:MAG: rhodanese [Pirellulaceae bacterium]|nr:rhodanese [Pirellulaceae bacterium]
MQPPPEQSETTLEITVQELHEMRESNLPHLLIDCRRNDEYQFCRIEGALHVPMNETWTRIGEFQSHADQPIIVYCHHGIRSLNVVQWLRQQGLPTARSMAGGIDAWTEHIDASVPSY